MRFSSYARAVSEHEAAGAWSIHVRAKKRQWAGEEGLIVLSIGDHDFTTDPEIIGSAVQSLEDGNHHYTPSIGIAAFREAIAAHHTKSFGEPVTAENVAVIPGAQCGVFVSGLSVLDPGDEVIGFDPMYVTYDGALMARGSVVKTVPLRPENGFLPDPAEIRAVLSPKTRAIIVNSPNNPTGVAWPRETLEAIAAICREADLFLISDEVYYSMCFDAPHISPRALDGMKERTAAVYSLSKSHAMTGWRMGWVIAEPEMISVIDEIMGFMMFGAPPFIQHAGITALTTASRVADEVRETYRGRRDAVVEALSDIPRIKVRKPDAGMFLMIDIRDTGMEAIDFANRLLDEQKLALLPGEGFGKQLAGHLRLSYGESEETLREAARRLGAFVQKNAA